MGQCGYPKFECYLTYKDDLVVNCQATIVNVRKHESRTIEA